MSRNLATNCGSLDSLYRRIRWGCRPWARQMRWTELTLIPTALAMAAPVQWVACAGGPGKVKATTRLVAPQPRSTLRAKPLLPTPDDGLSLSGPPHDLGDAVPGGCQQDDLGPPDMLLRAVPVGDN